MTAARTFFLPFYVIMAASCTGGGASTGADGSPSLHEAGTRGGPDAAEGGRAATDAMIPIRSDAAVSAPQDASMDGAAAPYDSSTGDSARLDDASRDVAAAPFDASRDAAAAPVDAGQSEAGEVDASTLYLRIPGWSVRKRIRSEDGKDMLLEEVLSSFADPMPGSMRIRMLSSGGATEHSFTAPSGSVLSDFCRHPSGAISAILIAQNRIVSLEQLSPDLTPLGTLEMHDPLIASDPHVTDAGAIDLLANGLAPDAARVASVGEAVVATVDTSWNSIVAYRASFSNGTWSELERTLIEPPVGLTPYLPIGGSFDTFGAMFDWYRALLDVDESGNAYIATWAGTPRIREHANVFGDGLAPLVPLPNRFANGDSDVIVTKMDPTGTRVWSRVVGTTFEDEPYAIRARGGNIAVVGRARRFTGFDNTAWDAFLSVVSSAGEPVLSRAFPLNVSSIFLAVDALPTGGWALGGSDGWAQNPDGLSVLSFGTKLLAVLPTIDGALVRVPLPDGPRHNEIRTVVADADHLWYGGHEDGPIMHTGDADHSLIVATGVLGSVSPIPSL
jgi:hypothetical protein